MGSVLTLSLPQAEAREEPKNLPAFWGAVPRLPFGTMFPWEVPAVRGDSFCISDKTQTRAGSLPRRLHGNDNAERREQSRSRLEIFACKNNRRDNRCRDVLFPAPGGTPVPSRGRSHLKALCFPARSPRSAAINQEMLGCPQDPSVLCNCVNNRLQAAVPGSKLFPSLPYAARSAVKLSDSSECDVLCRRNFQQGAASSALRGSGEAAPYL